ncbi:hypothetical protein ACEQ8H_004459 [Pleosporales sp. CAS-2024a]
MAGLSFDTNQWYQMYLGDDKNGQSFIGTSLYTGSGTKGAVFLKPSNTSDPVQRWQVFPVTVNDTMMYTFRSNDAGPTGFLATHFTPDEETEGKTRPAMFRGDVAIDYNAFWSIGSWGDGTWFLTNAANGTNYRMNKKDNAGWCVTYHCWSLYNLLNTIFFTLIGSLHRPERSRLDRFYNHVHVYNLPKHVTHTIHRS